MVIFFNENWIKIKGNISAKLRKYKQIEGNINKIERDREGRECICWMSICPSSISVYIQSEEQPDENKIRNNFCEIVFFDKQTNKYFFVLNTNRRKTKTFFKKNYEIKVNIILCPGEIVENLE